jgi:hypothetical protein
MTVCVGELGFALMMLTCAAISVHLAIVVLFGVSLTAVL